MSKYFFRYIFIGLQLFSIQRLVAQPSENSASDSVIYYTLKPIPLLDRTNLEISLNYKVKSVSAVVINLPEDYYGVPDLFKYVIAFEGLKGCVVKPTDKPNQRLVVPNKQNAIVLKYIISYDPKIMDGISFGPVVSTSQFHVAGCQWLLPIGDRAKKNRYEIRMSGVPKGWHLYSSLSSNPAKTIIYDSYENLLSSAIGGGAQAHKELTIYGKPVHVFVAGKYNIPDNKIFDAVNSIVSLQRNWFNDYAFPFYTVTILPRSGIIAGTCIPNLFVCFIKTDIEPDELNRIFSHEMFHSWLPNKISIKLSKGESELKYEWLTEGVTDYFARKVLLDAGLISMQQFAELINRDIINIADNPHHAATYTDLLNASKNGKYTATYKKLSYYRGALIALNWESQIRKSGNGKQLKDFIRELYDIAIRNSGEITNEEFVSIAQSFGLDVKQDLEQYIMKGLPIQPLTHAFGESYLLKETSIPLFDPGFSLEQTFKTRKIENVIENGAAHKAGLRNGMEFVAIRNSNRFGNGWSPDKPITVTVKSDGAEKIIEYFPHGKPAQLMLYAPVN